MMIPVESKTSKQKNKRSDTGDGMSTQQQSPKLSTNGSDSGKGKGSQNAAGETELNEKKEELQRKLQQALAENQELKEQILRVRAEAENFRKRIQREKEDFVRYAKEDFIREILPVKDNLERALEHGATNDNPQALLAGLKMVLEQFSSVFGKMGVRSFDSLGKPFDPSFHEAMMQQESAEHEPNTVIAEHQKGYLYHDRLLRPAMVTVAKAKEKTENKSEAKKENE